MKIVSLIGARPQFVKEAVLNREFKKHSQIEEIIINSGQHYDYNMADSFFEKLGITAPEYNLEVGSGTHAAMTAKIMVEFEKLMFKIKPDQILVYGDTNTTLAGALVAAKLKIPVSHVEAGIRMLPKNMPEEINRVLTDRIAEYLFCPSKRAVENLKKEGITEGVYFTGDVMYDLFLYMQGHFDFGLFNELNLKGNDYTLVTLHRDYNVDEPERFEKILKDLALLTSSNRVVFPMHPRTKKRIEEFGFEKYTEKFDILEPIDYLSLMGLMSNCKNVVTDSGGLQKESYFSHKIAYLFMPDPAWHELVDFGMNVLSEPGELMEHIEKEKKFKYVENIYGDGDAGEKIAGILLKK
ncbi:UDP-N-acetylglucosamine 2-epimerase (non-hydrolyzing) [bacterium]|nr:UDP-N-acetylglucosamine 2-epimerase (non-hydrolyzing) [bacterium]